MTEDERLERLLDAHDDAVLAAPDHELEAASDPATVAAILAGVLKAYGYQRDGSRLPATWRRGRRINRASTVRPGGRMRVAQPLRASFSATCDDDNEDDGENP